VREESAEHVLRSCLGPRRAHTYTHARSQRLLQDDEWTEEETNRLFELCRRFDLRFIVVHDHFIRMFPPGKGNPRRGQVTRDPPCSAACKPALPCIAANTAVSHTLCCCDVKMAHIAPG
jgi:hypothetical protein